MFREGNVRCGKSKTEGRDTTYGEKMGWDLEGTEAKTNNTRKEEKEDLSG